MKEIQFDANSFHALHRWAVEVGGELISSRMIAFVTSDPNYSSRLERQHVVVTDSGTLLVENALRCGSGPLYKVYWNALEPSGDAVQFRTLPKRRDGHHVTNVNSVPDWITTTSVCL